MLKVRMKFSKTHQAGFILSRYGILLILLFAFAIGLFHLAARTWHGDELGSIRDAQNLQRNLQALSYFVILRAWSLGSVGEFWTRTLSVFFAVLAIAVLFVMVKRQWGAKPALIACALLATSPFLENYSQQVRYYTLFLLAACLSYWAFFAYLADPSKRNTLYWGIATLFLISTHAMSILLILSQAVTLFFLSTRFSQRQKIAALAITLVLGAVLLISPIKALAFNALAYYTDATATFSESRGLSLAQVSKIPLTLFFFTLGEAVYPLDLKLVVPAILFFGITLVLGLRQMRRQPRILLFLAVSAVVSLVMLYLLFDALIPSTFGGAAPRYIIFLLPLFYLIIAAGTQQHRMQWLVAPLLLLNLGSLGSYWYGDWSYADDLVNWRAVTQWVGGYVTPGTLVLADGRSNDIANYYFPAGWNRQATFEFESPGSLRKLDQFSRVIFLSSDFHLDRREFASSLLEHLDASCGKTAVWSKYPLFIYVFDRSRTPMNTVQVDAASGNVEIPVEIYWLEFQDLALPLHLSFRDRLITSLGAFRLPAFDNQSSRKFSLAESKPAGKIVLFSNLTDADKLAPGTPIANLRVYSEAGKIQSIPLRAGYETAAWNQSCLPGGCIQAFTWRKRLALLGSERYPGSWEEFDASMFGIELNLDQSTQIRSLEFASLSPHNAIYVWGIVIEP